MTRRPATSWGLWALRYSPPSDSSAMQWEWQRVASSRLWCRWLPGVRRRCHSRTAGAPGRLSGSMRHVCGQGCFGVTPAWQPGRRLVAGRGYAGRLARRARLASRPDPVSWSSRGGARAEVPGEIMKAVSRACPGPSSCHLPVISSTAIAAVGNLTLTRPSASASPASPLASSNVSSCTAGRARRLAACASLARSGGPYSGARQLTPRTPRAQS